MNNTPLLSPILIGNRTAPKRFVILPMEGNDSDAIGSPTQQTIDRYIGFAEGRAGMIFVESLSVDSDSRSRINQLQITPENKKDLKQLVREIKAVNSETLVIFQLSHSGRFADPAFAQKTAVNQEDDEKARAVTSAEIEELSNQFIQATIIAWESGADGVDFKHCHGFLCGDFLRPANTRGDQYGGSFENRTRFFCKTLANMKLAVKDVNFIFGVRISACEGVPGGFGTVGPDEVIENFEEAVSFARLMEKSGVDFVSISAGDVSSAIGLLLPSAAYPQGIYQHFGWTKAIKDVVSIPVIGAGYSYLRNGKNDLDGKDPEHKNIFYWAEKNVRDGVVDLVGLGRQSLADPMFVKKVIEGKTGRIKYCIACNDCGTLLGNQKEVGCVIYNSHYRKIFKTIEA